MILKALQTGPLMVNCYIVGDQTEAEAAVFDPGGDADKILGVLDEHGLKLKYIVNTHAHWDHVGGNRGLQDATGAPILIHSLEAPELEAAGSRAGMFGSSAENSKASRFIKEGDTIQVGRMHFDVIDLRGHSPGGLGFVLEGRIRVHKNESAKQRKIVICGDALFAGSIGRTDFPGGDMEGLLQRIRSKIFTLPDDTVILPGHGPLSTVGQEKRSNPFF